jgi:tetraacyldisaccharide 4'-kinase
MSAVPLEEPRWWYEPAGDGVGDRALGALGRVMGAAAELRYKSHKPYRSRLPVVCIGNFTAGGTGKTPLTLLAIELLRSRGEIPVCLSRGYGGKKRGPVWVDKRIDSASTVGDEPMLLAGQAPVLVSRDREAGAKAIESATVAATAILMDDGLQNPGLAKDLSIAVVDGVRGLGNGRVIPAGPMRASLEFQLGLVDCVVVNGERDHDEEGHETVLDRFKRIFPGPVLLARPEPVGDVSWLAGARVVAYAGIGNPRRFFALLEKIGAKVVEAARFPDHHVFTEAEAKDLLHKADATGATLVTTEKDLKRLESAGGARAELRNRTRALPIRLAMDERDRMRMIGLLEGAVKGGAKVASKGKVGA